VTGKIDLQPLPPKEAIEAFGRKGYKIGFAWQDVWQEEHSRAFTVAKAMSIDLLADIRAAVQAALVNGTTLAQFQKELKPLLQAKGWWGKQYVRDPATGEEKLSQLGSTRRLRTIYDTNLRMSYAAGRWERINEVQDARPYLRYVAILDARTRPQHRAWHDTTLPVDHPFWKTHSPPNGWHCRCSLQQLSASDVKRMGLPVGDAPPSPMRAWLNPRTGERMKVPAGVDPGFGYNVGRSALARSREVLTEKLDAAAPDLAKAGIVNLLQSSDFKRFLQAKSPQDQGAYPVALGGGLADRLRLRLQTVELPIAAVQARELPPPEAWLKLQEVLDRGTVTGNGPVRRIRLEAGDRTYEAEVRRSKDGRLEVRNFAFKGP
jgi:SPP1 gp7 family putative phage head morphogenesis protein